MNRRLVERIKYSPLGRIATLPIRADRAFGPWLKQGVLALRWVAGSREWDNFSYDFDSIGVSSVAAAMSWLTGRPATQVRGHADELVADDTFRSRYRQRVSDTRLRYICDPEPKLGKCLFNYMLVRASRAHFVFEAGTERGLSALAMVLALRRNAAESGRPVHLVTVDIAVDRGEFLEGDEGGMVTRITGDSIEAIHRTRDPIDCFIHDTTNDPDHTRAQLAAVRARLAPGAVMHTSWFTREFVEFCEQSGFDYLEAPEQTRDHWYAGRRAGLARVPMSAPAAR